MPVPGQEHYAQPVKVSQITRLECCSDRTGSHSRRPESRQCPPAAATTKDARQPQAVMITPATSGPTNPAIGPTWLHVPSALPRRSAAKIAEMKAMPSGISPDAPMPCTARPAMSSPRSRRHDSHDRADTEDADAQQQQSSSAHHVAEATVERHQHHERQRKRDRHPRRHIGRNLEVIADDGQCDTYHGAGDGHDNGGHHQRVEDAPRHLRR